MALVKITERMMLSPLPTTHQANTQPILSVNQLRVVRGDVLLCAPVNFELWHGDVIHIQGMNGIGKTTLLKMLMGILPASITSIHWQHTIDAPLTIRYLGHQLALYPALSVWQNLRFLLTLGDGAISIEQAQYALAQVDLPYELHTPVYQLSAGQKRRVVLAQLWISKSDVWVLDEPFTALDSMMREYLSAHMQQFTTQGGAIVMTSHQAVDYMTQTVMLVPVPSLHMDVAL